MQFVQVAVTKPVSSKWGGRYGKNIISIFIFRHFTILSQFFVMLVLPVCLSSTAKLIFPIIKTKPFKEQNINKNGGY